MIKNFTNINQTNNHLLPQTIEHKKNKTWRLKYRYLLRICTKMWRSEADEWYSPNYRI